MENYRKYIKDDYLLYKLESIHQKKEQLKGLLDKKGKVIPYIVELSGLPRTGKTVTTERLSDFFRFGGISVGRTNEPAQIIKDTMSKEELAKMSNLDFNNKTLEISKNELNDLIGQDKAIIIQDRGVIDNYFWYQMMYEEGTLPLEEYEKVLLKFVDDLLMMDKIYVMTADPEIIILRDYLNSIYLEDRKKTTLERVTMLKTGLEHLLSKIPDSYKNVIRRLDTTDIDDIGVSILIADEITSGMIRKLTR